MNFTVFKLQKMSKFNLFFPHYLLHLNFNAKFVYFNHIIEKRKFIIVIKKVLSSLKSIDFKFIIILKIIFWFILNFRNLYFNSKYR